MDTLSDGSEMFVDDPKSLLNTNRDFVTDCAFQLNILLIMTVKPKQVQPVSSLKTANFKIFYVKI